MVPATRISSCLPNRALRVGPTFGLPSTEWQARQPLDVSTARPGGRSLRFGWASAARKLLPGSGASSPPKYQALNSSSGTTMTLLSMRLWSTPQMTVHSMSYEPSLVAWNQVVLVRAGTASILRRNEGMKNPCTTSALWTSIFMGLLMGAKRTLLFLPLGYSKDQLHWRAVTFTTMASRGAWRMYS